MAISQNVNGVIKKITKFSQNANGTIKTFISYKENVGGTLKELLNSTTLTNKMRYVIVVNNISSSPPSTSTNTYQTTEMVKGFTQLFSISITAIYGTSSINTVEPAVMTEDCTMSLSYSGESSITVYVNGNAVTENMVSLSVGDEISISGSVSVSGATSDTSTASVRITLS